MVGQPEVDLGPPRCLAGYIVLDCWELSGKFRLEIPSYINDVEGDV
jgi:hypothetical protein